MSEKYIKQQQVELLNKQIMQKILNEVPANEFIKFYLGHNQKETMDEYGIRTTKQLRKILEAFNYDFSKPKPSKYKGKASPRSHESYIIGGQKSRETQKQNWENKTKEEKEAWSQKQTIAHSTTEFKNKIKKINVEYQASLTQEERERIKKHKAIINKQIWQERGNEIISKARQTCLEKYGVDNFTKTDSYRRIIASEDNLVQRARKTYQTKKLKQSFSTSAPEERYYVWLCEKYGKDDVIRQYRDDDRYPFNCDFYIKSLDLFIELNFTWSHGGHIFDVNNIEDIKKLNKWKEKAETSDYYKNAIDIWTNKDPLKINTAKANKLNYLVYYSEGELYAE